MITALVWVYMLGMWPIGPFPTRADCEAVRTYQIEQGGVPKEHVGPCQKQDSQPN